MTTTGNVLRIPIFFLLLMASAFSIFLVRFSVGGLPVRVLLIFMIGTAVAALYPRYILASVVSMRWPLMVIAYAAICALVSSYFARNDMARSFGQVFEIHIQAAINVVICNALLYMLGLRKFAFAMLLPMAFSGFIAMMQFFSIPGGWDLYHAFAALQPQSTADLEFFSVESRPLGLSYSPVHLGTQICHVFALAYCMIELKFSGRRTVMSSVYLGALILFVATVATVSGNRSPTLGLIIFFAVYIVINSPRFRWVLLAAGAAVYLVGDAMVQLLAATGLRVFNTTNSSGEGREVLRAYGWLLFVNKPVGYGILFDSTRPELWSRYLSKLFRYDHSGNIAIHALHNSYLMTINKHGVQLFLLIPFLARWLLTNRTIFYAYIPYAVHIYYHNDGPLQGDFLFWYVLPAVMAASQMVAMRQTASEFANDVRYSPADNRRSEPASA